MQNNNFLRLIKLTLICFLVFVSVPPQQKTYAVDETYGKRHGDEHHRRTSQKTGLYGQLCEGSRSFLFKTFPIDPENIEAILPMGRVQDSHVIPTDHQYVIPRGTKSGSLVTDNPQKFELKTPADGYVIS